MGAWSPHSPRLRRAATDEENLPPAPTSTCSFSSPKAAHPAPELLRRRHERASAPWLPRRPQRLAARAVVMAAANIGGKLRLTVRATKDRYAPRAVPTMSPRPWEDDGSGPAA